MENKEQESSDPTFKNEKSAQKIESLSTKSIPVGKPVTAKAQESSDALYEDDKTAKKVTANHLAKPVATKAQKSSESSDSTSEDEKPAKKVVPTSSKSALEAKNQKQEGKKLEKIVTNISKKRNKDEADLSNKIQRALAESTSFTHG